MNQLRFSSDHEKLHVPPGGLFTTVRRSDPENVELFREGTGEVFDIAVDLEIIMQAELLQVFRGQVGNLSGPFLQYDCYDVHQSRGVKYNDEEEVLVLLLRCKSLSKPVTYFLDDEVEAS